MRMNEMVSQSIVSNIHTLPHLHTIRRRIVCILHQKYRIIHRDISYTNFVIDAKTGFISLIDYGDAFVAETPPPPGKGTDGKTPGTLSSSSLSSPSSSLGWTYWMMYRKNWNRRNMINAFNIWLKGYNELSRLDEFIDNTRPHIYGTRQWRPPSIATKWDT